MSGGRGSKSMSVEREAAARRFVSRLVDEHFEKNQSHAAKAFGISQGCLNQFILGAKGIGPTFLERVADYARCSIDAGRTGSVSDEDLGEDQDLDICGRRHGRVPGVPMTPLVERYATALTKLAVWVRGWHDGERIAGPVLRSLAPCEMCGGDGTKFDIKAKPACEACGGAGWTQASLGAHIAEEQRQETERSETEALVLADAREQERERMRRALKLPAGCGCDPAEPPDRRCAGAMMRCHGSVAAWRLRSKAAQPSESGS